jgi:hypothetical protein
MLSQWARLEKSVIRSEEYTNLEDRAAVLDSWPEVSRDPERPQMPIVPSFDLGYALSGKLTLSLHCRDVPVTPDGPGSAHSSSSYHKPHLRIKATTGDAPHQIQALSMVVIFTGCSQMFSPVFPEYTSRKFGHSRGRNVSYQCRSVQPGTARSAFGASKLLLSSHMNPISTPRRVYLPMPFATRSNLNPVISSSARQS